jgi:hypothetical protein
MPPWMEILLNVIGYAGFIGIAKYRKPSDESAPDHEIQRMPGVSSPGAVRRRCAPAGRP